jgi:hypothetical protein
MFTYKPLTNNAVQGIELRKYIQSGLSLVGKSFVFLTGKAAKKCSAYLGTPSRLLEKLSS